MQKTHSKLTQPRHKCSLSTLRTEKLTVTSTSYGMDRSWKSASTQKILLLPLIARLHSKNIFRTTRPKRIRGTTSSVSTSPRNGEQILTLRTSALALCYSALEHACPVWSRSSHAKYLDPAQNDSCRIITGCLKPTNANSLYLCAGIVRPDIRREVISRWERYKAMHDPSHMLCGSKAANQRFKSRKSFLDSTPLLISPSEETRLELWKELPPPKPALNTVKSYPPETGPKYRAS